MPYERIVQWAAGPAAILAGWLATQITNHVGGLGLGHDTLAHAILDGLVFAVSAGATYAAHHKWLSNLVSWWGRPTAPARWIPAASVTSQVMGPTTTVTTKPNNLAAYSPPENWAPVSALCPQEDTHAGR